MTLIPRAIAPLVTTITSSPPLWRAASSPARPPSTSMRSSPSLAATTLEPSLTTILLTAWSLFVALRPPWLLIGGVQLEGDAADLDLVARLEARLLQGAQHP